MSGQTLRGILETWVGSDVTIINPESYRATALGEGLSFQSYGAKLIEVCEDHVRLGFTATKKEIREEVEQFIPHHRIKRISLWGNEKLIHI